MFLYPRHNSPAHTKYCLHRKNFFSLSRIFLRFFSHFLRDRVCHRMYSVPKEVYISDQHIPAGGYMHVIHVNCGIPHGLSPTVSLILPEMNLKRLDVCYSIANA